MVNKKEIITKIKKMTYNDKLPILMSSLAMILSLYGIFETKQTKNDTYIEVSGSCLKRIEKDKYKTELIVKFTDKKSSASALRKSKKLFTELVEFTNKLKTEDKTIETQTSRIEVFEEKNWSNKYEKYIYEGYTAEMGLIISSEKSDILEKVINFASGKNNVLIDRIENYVSNQKMKTERELCLAEAIKNAKYQAEFVTKAAGNKIGKLVSVYANSNNYSAFRSKMITSNFAGDTSMKSEGSIIEKSGYDMNVIVHARFEIK